MKKITPSILARVTMTLLLAALSSIGAWAEDKAPGIVVWMNNGDKTAVLFADMPEFTYADGYVTLTSNSPSTTISWPLEDLQKMTFEQVSTGIRDIKATGLDIVSDKMAVYDLNGRLVKKGVKSLSELPKGTYIVKDGSTPIKVQRR